MKKIIFGLILLLFLLGCVSETNPKQITQEDIVERFNQFEYNYCNYEDASHFVARNNAEWERLWIMTAGKGGLVNELPKIDFDNEMIVAVFQGGFSSDGYHIEITNINENPISNKLKVYFQTSEPGPFETVTMALTAPCYLMKIDKSEKEVVFIEGFTTHSEDSIPLDPECYSCDLGDLN